MTTEEHLNRIKAKCQELLALAEKRTPGKWIAASESVWGKVEADERICDMAGGWDPDFIAACAGPAEAGWRATIAAIEMILSEPSVPDGYSQPCVDDYMNNLATSIIAAWPEELLS